MKILSIVYMAFAFILILSADAMAIDTSRVSRFLIHVDAGVSIKYSSAFGNVEVPLQQFSCGRMHLLARAGFGAVNENEGHWGLGGLAGLTLLSGRHRHHLEIGSGLFLGKNQCPEIEDETLILPVIDIGYRYQEPGNAMFFRAKAGWLGVGVGLGYAF